MGVGGWSPLVSPVVTHLYPKELDELHYDFACLLKGIKVYNLVANLHEKLEYLIDIRKLKQALDHELILKKLYKVNKFNQEVWLKPYIDMSVELKEIWKMI